MNTLVQFRHEPDPGDGFGPAAFADAMGRRFALLVDGRACGTGEVTEVWVDPRGRFACITIETADLLPTGVLGATQLF